MRCPSDAPAADYPQALLPFFLAIYSHWSQRNPDVPQEVDDNIGNDFFEDGAQVFMESSWASIIGSALLTWSVLWLSRPSASSTVICPASESWSSVVTLQCLGVVLDAAILVILWRILQWARTGTERFVNLGWILLAPAFFIVVFAFGSVLIRQQSWGSSQVLDTEGIGFHYWVQVIFQSAVLVFISSVLFAQQHSLLASASIVTFLCGAYVTWERLYLIGTYVYVSKAQALGGLCLLSIGFVILAYREHIRHIYFTRVVILIALVGCIFGSMIYSLVVTGILDRHPVDRLIYSSRTDGARWLVQDAHVSESLLVATREYQERHGGRSPPPNFDIWYDFATTRNSAVIDYFKQIDDDLQPFWSIKPKEIQNAIAEIGASRGIALISIKKGVVAPQPSSEPYDDAIIGDLVDLLQPFAQHLPDMDLPVNLLDRPRVLAPSPDAARNEQQNLQDDGFMSSRIHQHQLGQTCPGNAKSRSGFYALTRNFCWSCAKPQSLQQFPWKADEGRDLCHQPDMLNLHGFYIGDQPLKPFTEFVPVFSRTKTAQHQDILMPLSRGTDDYAAQAQDKPLLEKTNQVFWRGEVKAEKLVPQNLLSGGHQERLSHLINNASDSSFVTILLAKDGDKARFKYEDTPLEVANRVLKFDVGISDYSTCTAPGCDKLKNEFGVRPMPQDATVKMNSRYVMVMDSDEGPPRDLLQTLKSTSVPLVASIFRVSAPDLFMIPFPIIGTDKTTSIQEWYTERLFPWMHYVPIDFRFHAVHSTMAYFLGLEDKGLINGRVVPLSPHLEDAKWISQEGRQWAHKAIRREDAQIYMFRLLLEWGRVIDEKREELGFVGRTGTPA